MTIKLLQMLSIMTLVMLISVGQAMDVFAYKMFTDDGTTVLTCDDNDMTCDEEGVPGIITQTGQNAVCDLIATQVSAATKTAIGDAMMLELDKDLNCSSNQNTLGTFTYTISEVDFFGKQIVCTTTGGGSTIGEGNVKVKFWISSGNGHFETNELLFEVDSLANGDIPWSGQVAVAAPGGAYSFTMETIVLHDEPDAFNISTYDLKVVCEPTVAGELLPISTQSLMLGGIGMSLTWLVPVMATIGGTAAYIKYRRN